MATKAWAEVQADPQYQALPPEEKESARQQYFTEVIAPQVPPEEVEAARAEFDNSTSFKVQRKAKKTGWGKVAEGAKETGKALVGALIETPITMAAGAATAPIAGLAGVGSTVGNLFKGKSLSDSLAAGGETTRNVQSSVANAVDKTVNNDYARATQGAISAPFQMANAALGKAGGAIGEAVGGEQGRLVGESIGENAIDLGSALYGAGGLAKGIILKSRRLKPTLSETQTNIQKAVDKGYTAMPADASPTIKNKLGTVVAGKENLADTIAAKNSKVSTELVKQDIGLNPEQSLNKANIQALRENAERDYQAIRELDDLDLTPDAELDADLIKGKHPTVGDKEAAASDPNYYKRRTSEFERLRHGIMNPAEGWTPAAIMQHVKNLRKDANDLFKGERLSPNERARASAMRSTADAFEKFLDRKVTESYYKGKEPTAPTRPPQGILPGKEPQPQLPGRSQVTQYSNVDSPAGTSLPPKMEAPGMPQMPAKHGGTLEHVDNSKRDVLVQNFKKARQLLAKLHDVEAVTNLSTEEVDAAALHRMKSRGAPLTGGLADIADAHEVMPEVVKKVGKDSSSNTDFHSVLNFARAAGRAAASAATGYALHGGVTGAVVGAAVPSVVRHAMASKRYAKEAGRPAPTNAERMAQLRMKDAGALVGSSARPDKKDGKSRLKMDDYNLEAVLGIKTKNKIEEEKE